MTGYSLGDSVSERLTLGMESVEQLLRDSVTSDHPVVMASSRHLVDAGGKRFRPLLVLLAAQFGPRSVTDDVIRAAAVVELTHLATLYHDDVMDEAERRRGVDSANKRWSNSLAILTGDYLFSRASELLADLGPEAVRIQAQTFARLVTGQIKESVGPQPGDDPVKYHLSVLADKTGSLIATSGRFGAMFSEASPAVVETLTRFGENIGVAFQLADDLVDLQSVDGESGKTRGTDLREGVLTLPSLIVLQSRDPADERLQELLQRPLVDDDEHAEALSSLVVHSAMEEARHEAQWWADSARHCLADLPDIPARRELESICNYVVTRTA